MIQLDELISMAWFDIGCLLFGDYVQGLPCHLQLLNSICAKIHLRSELCFTGLLACLAGRLEH